MNHLLKSSALVLLALFATTLASAQKDVKVEIMEANERFMALFSAGDATAFVEGMYTKDAVLMPPNSPLVSGKDNLVAMWANMMGAGIRPEVVTNSASAQGKTAIEDGTVKIYAGDDVVDELKYIVIWKKEKGMWKMHKDIWNSSRPSH